MYIHFVRSSLACLTSHDSTGETALHSAARSKASGFARLFARARKSRPSQELLELFGLRNNMELANNSRFLLTLQAINSLITHRDIDLILEYIQREHTTLNVTTLLDQAGNTILHLAVYGGRRELVRALLDANLVTVDSRNYHGITPLHFAFAGHFCKLAKELVTYGARYDAIDGFGRLPHDVMSYSQVLCSPLTSSDKGTSERSQEVAFQTDISKSSLWNKYIASGWNPTSSQGPVAFQGLGDCGIDVRNSSLTSEDFVRQYKAIYRPVLIQGLVRSWPAWNHWTREALLQR